jgi:hypothetical protein
MSQMITDEESTRTPAAKRALLRPQPAPEGRPPSSLGPAPEPPRLGGASLVLTFLILIVIGSIIGSCYLTYRMVGSVADLPGRVLGGVRDALDAGDPTYSTLPAVIEQLRPLARLQTEEYFLSTVVEATQPRGAGGVLTEKLVLIACGRVTAGVDLAKIGENDVRTEGNKVVIKLPPAEVFETALEEESGCTRIYDRSVPPLMSATKELDSEVRRQALEGFRQTALENGILERAYVRAQEEVARLLLLAGYETVEFTDVGEEILLPQE